MKLIITSPTIKYVQTYKSTNKKTGEKVYSYTPYYYTITVVFRECSDFEIITSHTIAALSDSVQKCLLCPDLSFSKNKLVCEQCPVGASCAEG